MRPVHDQRPIYVWRHRGQGHQPDRVAQASKPGCGFAYPVRRSAGLPCVCGWCVRGHPVGHPQPWHSGDEAPEGAAPRTPLDPISRGFAPT